MTLRDRQVLEPAPEQPRVRPAIPYVSGALLGLSVLFFFLDDTFQRPVTVPGMGTGLLQIGALLGPLVRQGEWWRVVAYAVEHGNGIHLFLNMSVVWTLGFAFERAVGSWRFFVITLATTVGAAAFALLFNFDVPTVGASGTILGWAGAMLPIATQQGRRHLFTWLAQVALISFLPGVSWAGHAGGFLFGLPYGLGLRFARDRFGQWAPVVLFLAAVLTVVAVRTGGLSSR